MFLIAHEMRHYYQMRQIDSAKPKEEPEMVELWRKDEKIPCDITEDFDEYEFYKRPMELDAQLFAYCFVATMKDALVSVSYISDDYIDILEEYYIKLFNETNEELFPHPKVMDIRDGSVSPKK